MRMGKPGRSRAGISSSRRTVNIPLLRRRLEIEPVSMMQFNRMLIFLQSKITEIAADLS
jgi:hypothetical protein